MLIRPISHPLQATVRVPGSKSLTNRALLIAALADGTTTLETALFSDDSHYFAEALQTLGFDVSLDPENSSMTVTGLGGRIPVKRTELFIGNAGTAARFLTAFLTLGSGEYILDGDTRMRQRPIGDLVAALQSLGVQLGPADTDHWSLSTDYSSICPPIKIIADGLPGGQAQIAGDVSSQFLSALLMVAPYAQSPVEIEVTTELNSKPYVDMTLSIMRDFGVSVERDDYKLFSVTPSFYSPISTYLIESDASAASYFFAAPAVCGGVVSVENITRQSVQGDIAFLDILARMGCTVTETDHCLLVTGHSSLRGLDIDMRDIPDTAQTLAAIAPFASAPTRIRGIASARVKETDRVHATCTELARLGVKVEEHEDGMTIYPCDDFRPATVQTYNDHRMAMAFSLIGLRVPGIEIENPGCVSKTFPDFFGVLDSLRFPLPLGRVPKRVEGWGEGDLASKLQLGLTGYPLGHSLSPQIHRAALDACGLQGDYSLFPIHPDDQQGLKDLLAHVRNGEIHGLNVTIPHKQNVISLLDKLTSTAQAIGAVNTISMQNGKLTGDNTDAPGFLADLQRFLTMEILRHGDTKSVLVLGAGGSARAVVYALIDNGWNVTVAARRIEQAQAFISQFPNPDSRISAIEFQTTNLQSLIPNFSLLVNTTPLGMTPNVEVSPWPVGLPFPPNATIYDLVYNPQETRLVREAHAAGLSATTGLGMLIEQAALAFEIWTGYDPPRDALWKTIDGSP